MNELFPIEKTDILRYCRKKSKRVSIKECDIINNFLFNKIEFYLVYKAGYFFVCTPQNKELIMLWFKKGVENKEKITPGEVTSEFRKKYLKNEISQERLGLFLDNPLEYEKKYPKSLDK